MEEQKKEEVKKQVKAVYLRYDNRQRAPFGLVVFDGEHFGWSLCAPCDQFDRKKARVKALARLAAKKDYLTLLSQASEVQEPWEHKRETFTVEGLGMYRTKLDVVADTMLLLANDEAKIREKLARRLTRFEKTLELYR